MCIYCILRIHLLYMYMYLYVYEDLYCLCVVVLCVFILADWCIFLQTGICVSPVYKNEHVQCFRSL